MLRIRTLIAVVLVVLAPLVAARGAVAFHPPVPTVGLVNVEPGGEVTVRLVHDALAFALNDTSVRVGDAAMYALLDGPDSEIEEAFTDGVARLKVGLRLAADGRPLAFEVIESPSLVGVKEWLKDHPDRRLPCKMDFAVRGRLPVGAKGLTVRFPEILSDVLVVIERPGLDASEVPLASAEVSPPFDVHMATVGDEPGPSAGEPVTRDIGVVGVFWRYIEFGFRHIIPLGADHACFVLGLFLLTPRLKPVLLQITAFTAAHTLTLTLTTLHIVGLPSSIIEPVIALSVVFIGVENLMTKEVHRWRYAVAFVFGLVHGMGVAGAFAEVGFAPGRLIASLTAFTIGVEAGHIAVLALAFVLLGWFRDKPWYRARVVVPLSCLIALVAAVWTVQRMWPSG